MIDCQSRRRTRAAFFFFFCVRHPSLTDIGEGKNSMEKFEEKVQEYYQPGCCNECFGCIGCCCPHTEHLCPIHNGARRTQMDTTRPVHYRERLAKAQAAGLIPIGGFHECVIRHDAWCDLMRGTTQNPLPCTCKPDIVCFVEGKEVKVP